MATDNLVLNGKPIDTIEEIIENFSPEDMLRDFKNGVLERWLYNHMEDEKFAQIKSLAAKKPTDEDALNGIVEVFGVDIGSAGQNLYKTGMSLLEGKDGERDARRAVEFLRKAANMGIADAQYQLAECWNEGISESNWLGACKDRSEAISLYKAAAEQGHPDAQLSYGDELGNAESVHWWELAAKNPRASAVCRAFAKYNLGTCYAEGRYGARKNIVKALELYEEAADENDRDVLWWVGDKFREGEGVAENPHKAFELYSKAAKEGSLEGQYWLAWCYDTGFGVRENPEKARDYYLKVADAADCSGEPEIAWALYRIAEFYRLGLGVPKDPEKACDYYKKSSEQDYSVAQYWLGWCYENEFGAEKNLREAFGSYKKAAEGGCADAQFALARCYWNWIGCDKNEDEALRWCEKAVAQGHAEAMFELAERYRYARDVPFDGGKAKSYYKNADEAGNHAAQRELGKLFLKGDKALGIVKNERHAVECFERAVDGADPDFEALRLLGTCYYDGVGVFVGNKEKAFECYKKAAAGDHPDAEALRRLGNCYFYGIGTDRKDDKKAFECYKKGAKLFDAKAMYNLSMCYLKGVGVGRDLRMTIKWCREAATLGDEDAKKLLSKICS